MKDSKKIRFIDRYVGSAACFIFSLIHKLKPSAKERKPVKNVLALELFEMGAAIMIHPSLLYIKEHYKDVNLYCLTTRGMKKSWMLLRVIPEENILVLDDRNMISLAVSLIKTALRVRKLDLDLVIDYELFMRITSIISFMLKTERRAGFYKYEMEGLYRGSFTDHRVHFNQNSHISKNFLALTKAAVNNEDEYPNYKGNIMPKELTLPAYLPDESVRKSLSERIKEKYPQYSSNKLISICPDVGANISVRNYPAEKITEVVSMILERYPDHLILLIGTETDWNTSNLIEKNSGSNRCINFCGLTYSLEDVLELLSMSELLISNDNGPVHFASLAGIKTLAIFSTDSPFIYGPIGKALIVYDFFQCSPCIMAYNHKNTQCNNNLCLQSIEPERVFDFAVRLMEGEVNYMTINNKVPYIF